MEDKLKPEEIKHYSREFAAATVRNFFSNRDRITGSEIINFCEVKQVNLFILLELMKAWAQEKSKLLSPYFDYTHKEVQDSLTQFHNTLSNHISIQKQDFVPLLEAASQRALSVIISPYDFYSSVLDNNGSEYVGLPQLKAEVKYLKVNKAPLESLVKKLEEEKKVEKISGKEAFAMLDTILEEVNFSPEDPETYLNEFSNAAKVKLSRFYEPLVKSQPTVKKVAPAQKAKSSSQSQTTLYDQLSAHESKPTLAENFQKKKIAKLRDSLSINQKFMFTKMLFNGDFEFFSQAIERIDMFDNLSQAMNYLQSEYPDWDTETEEFEEFMMMVQKRFTDEG
jgi:hypothetical protein